MKKLLVFSSRRHEQKIRYLDMEEGVSSFAGVLREGDSLMTGVRTSSRPREAVDPHEDRLGVDIDTSSFLSAGLLSASLPPFPPCSL